MKMTKGGLRYVGNLLT